MQALIASMKNFIYYSKEERFHQKQGSPSIVALDQSITEVMNQNSDQVTITKRFVADMREIWSLQPRLERRLPRQVKGLVEHPRFRAAYDFLLLRAQLGHLNEAGLGLAQWWDDFYFAQPEERIEIIAVLRSQPTVVANEGPKKRRRRRKTNAKKPTTEGASE